MVKEKFEKIIQFSPAYDKRNEDSTKDYGIGSVGIFFVLRRKNKAVSVRFGTDWFLQSTIDEYITKGNRNLPPPIILRKNKDWLEAWSIDFHSNKPWYDDQTSCGDCCWIKTKKAYCDGSCLRAGKEGLNLAEVLLTKGSKGVWEILESEWEDRFGDSQPCEEKK